MNTQSKKSMMSGGGSSSVPYSLLVGDRTHRVIGAVLAEGISDIRRDRALQVLAMTSTVLREHPIEHGRSRAAGLEIGSASACYLQRFQLAPAWGFQAAEVPLGGGRADLTFRSSVTGQWLVDEVKMGRSRSDEPALRPQIDRYLHGGRNRWGEQFLGVRLCALAQPRQSRFFSPNLKRSMLLTESPLAGGVA